MFRNYWLKYQKVLGPIDEFIVPFKSQNGQLFPLKIISADVYNKKRDIGLFFRGNKILKAYYF
jgi:hypothetical protein